MSKTGSSSRKRSVASKTQSGKSKSGVVRIIAGHWRGSKLEVLNQDGLRPTADRVRETVFNWLMHDLPGARCLDLCAGTGALGFEALSRGAKSVTMVDASHAVCQSLQLNAKRLLEPDSERFDAQIVHADAISYLQSLPASGDLDLLFIDPPYQLNNHQQLFELVEQSGALSENALIYSEYPKQRKSEITAPSNWQTIKEKNTGNVYFCLYLRNN